MFSWSSGQPTVQCPGSSRGLLAGAGIRTHNLGLPWVSSPMLYPLALSCHVKCLISAMPVVSLRAVFMTAALTWSWVVCLLVVDFIPCPFPNVRSLPPTVQYLAELLATGTIVSSTSPAGAGFFFVKKKDGSSLH